MTNPRVDQQSHAGASQAWAGAGSEGAMPVPGAGAGGAARADGDATCTGRGGLWRRRVLRVARDFLIGALLCAAVPLWTAYRTGNKTSNAYGLLGGNTLEKLREAQPSRPFVVPKDASVDPLAAGRALASLNDDRRSDSYTYATVDKFKHPWALTPIPDGLRPTGGASWHGPNSQTVIATVARGVSAEDVAYLRMIAEAPLWQAWDLVARAPAVDVLGGRFVLPFGDRARSYDLPILRFAGTKELAYASVSRAAYYLAIGKPAEAEAVLRRTISLGFVLIDNSATTFDALIGRVIVEIGRGALQDLYRVTNDPRLKDVVAAGQRAPINGLRRDKLTVNELLELALAEAENTSLPRAVRLQALNTLSYRVCSSPRALIFGPPAEVRDAFAQASRDFARFPSEKEWLALVLESPSKTLPQNATPNMFGGRVSDGASAIASVIFQNPRMLTCSLLNRGYF